MVFEGDHLDLDEEMREYIREAKVDLGVWRSGRDKAAMHFYGGIFKAGDLETSNTKC